MSVLVH